ncbi:MAG: GldG family protein [Treponema sp.]|nr:GldG family protein [Treponema sp.]
MNHSCVAYLKKIFFSFIIHPVFYIVVTGLVVNSAFFCFIYQRFFYIDIGSTDLHYFFSVFLYIATFFVPLLSLIQRTPYDTFLPLSTIEKLVVQWFAGCIVCFGVVACLCTIPFCMHFFGFVDIGQTVSGFLGIFLYLLVLYALSICCSSLFLHSFVAYCLTILISFVLLASHLCNIDSFTKGIIDSKACIILLGYVFLLLCIAWIVIEKRKGKNIISRRIFYIFICYVLVLLNNSRYYCRFDVTQNRAFSLEPYTKELLSQIQQEIPLRVTYVVSKELRKRSPLIKDISDFLTLYCEQNSRITYNRVDADDTIISTLQSLQIVAQQIQTEKGYQSVYSCILLEYAEKIELIPFIIDVSGLEYDLDIRVDRLLSDKMRNIYLIAGNGEDLAADYSAALYYMQYQGFNPIVLSENQIQQTNFDMHIPMVVLGSALLTEQDVACIENYLSYGGKLFCAVSPYTVTNWELIPQSLDPLLLLLDKNGFCFENAIVADSSCANIIVADAQNAKKTLSYPLWPIIKTSQQHNLSLFWPAAIQCTNTKIKPLLQSSTQSQLLYIKNNDSVFINPIDFTRETLSDERGPFVVGALLQNGIESFYTANQIPNTASLFVLSDPYFIQDMMLSYSVTSKNDYRNLDCFISLVLYLNQEAQLAQVHDKTSVSYMVNPQFDLHTVDKLKKQILLGYFIYFPSFVILIAVYIVIRRRKRYANF